MTLRALAVGAVSTLLVSGLALVATARALAAEAKTLPHADLELHFALRLDESGEAKLFLEMPASDEFLRLLLDGQPKHPAVFLTASKSIPYGEVVKAIDRLGARGLRKISLATKHEKAAP